MKTLSIFSKSYLKKMILKFELLFSSFKNKNRILIGRNTNISIRAILDPQNGYIKIGNNCTIHEFCVLYGNGGLEIGNNCRIAVHSVFIGENHKFNLKEIPITEQGLEIKGIKIGDDCWIGCNCSILAGVQLGKGCVVGAGSVVNNSFQEYSVIAGNPAKLIGKRGE